MKGETVEEIAGAARAMRRTRRACDPPRPMSSTPAAPAATARHVQHLDRRGAASPPGAGLRGRQARQPRDVGRGRRRRRAGGARRRASTSPPERVAACLDEVGIGFLFAQRFHPAMRHVAGAAPRARRAHDLQPARPARQPGRCAGAGARRLRPRLGRAARAGARPARQRGAPWSCTATTASTRSRSPARRWSPSCATARCAPIASTPTSVGLQPLSGPTTWPAATRRSNAADHPRRPRRTRRRAARWTSPLLNAAAALYVGGAGGRHRRRARAGRAPRWTAAPRAA